MPGSRVGGPDDRARRLLLPHISALAYAVTFPVAAVFCLAASAVLVSRIERLGGALPAATLGLVVAFAADLPEIVSAVTASAGGQGTIGVGVVLGSNVFNLAALLGLSALVAGKVKFHRRAVLLEGATGSWVAIVTLIVIEWAAGRSGGATLAAGVGLVLVAVVVVPYVLVPVCSEATLVRTGLPPRLSSWLSAAVADEELELASSIGPRQAGWRGASPGGRSGGPDVAVALLSLGAVVLASAAMESSAQHLGSRWAVPKFVVGGVVLAAVTSLPNAVAAVYLAVRRRGEAVLSEAMNSNMLNVVAGLLVPGLFAGLGGPGHAGALAAGWYAVLTLVVVAMAFGGRGLSRSQGAAIIAAYGVFVALAVAFP